MKFFAKQMLGFVAVLLAFTTITGIFFAHSIETSSLLQINRELEIDADSLVQDTMHYEPALKSFSGFDSPEMNANANLLAKQGIHFNIYDTVHNKRFSSNGYTPQPSRADWRRLRRGETIAKVIAHPTKPRTPKGKGHSGRPNHNADVADPTMTVIEKPYFYHSRMVAIVSIGAFRFEMKQRIQHIEQNIASAFLISIAVSLLIASWLAAHTNRRIKAIQRGTQAVARGNYNVHLTVPKWRGDELDDLSCSFNGMTNALAEANKEIKRESDSRQSILANAAHEMRTPLTTINGLLEGLEYNAIPDEDKQHSIELMRKETGRLIRMVSDTLDYEKLRTNRISLQRKNFDSSAVLHNLAEQLNKKAAEKNDQIEVDVPGHLVVYADYDRFIQIMFNIIQNAVQFTKDGHIKIHGEKQAHWTVYTISDTGIGMSPEQTEHIWDRFYKADASRSTKYGESGIGMAIVAKLMHLHGGQIQVASQLGKGTTFTVKFLDRQQAMKLRQRRLTGTNQDSNTSDQSK